MPPVDHLAAIESESARFVELVSVIPMDTPVPSCPGWTVADLTWHVAEVQHFWGSIVAGLLSCPAGAAEPDRPDDTELPAFLAQRTAALLEAVTARRPGDVCWSWHDAGHSVGWVGRRQAHEALIHRIDAELAAGTVFRVDEALAADGVDEILQVMLDIDNLPQWAVFETEGENALIELDDGSASWTLGLGRFRGTSPNSGRGYDFPVVSLVPRAEDPVAVLRGSPADLDLWLWGRGPLDATMVISDRTAAEHIRATAIETTQ